MTSRDASANYNWLLRLVRTSARNQFWRAILGRNRSGETMLPLARTTALAIAVCAAPVLAQEPRSTGASPASNAKPLLTEADFARIETLGATALSPDGKWIAYDFRRGASGPTELRYRAVTGGPESSVSLGHTPVFTERSQWLLFTVTPDTAKLNRGAGGRGSAAAAAAGRGASASA